MRLRELFGLVMLGIMLGFLASPGSPLVAQEGGEECEGESCEHECTIEGCTPHDCEEAGREMACAASPHVWWCVNVWCPLD